MVYKPHSHTPRTRPGQPICTVASAYCDACEPPVRGRITKAYFATLEEQRHEQPAAKGKKAKIDYTASFRQTAQAVPGRRIWLVVETAGLEGVTLEITIRCAKTDLLLTADAALTLIHEGTERQSIQARIGSWDGGGRYQHKEMYRNWAIIELRPGPATQAARTEWAKKLEGCSDHRAQFYVEVRALTGAPVDYANETPLNSGFTQDKSMLLHQEGRHLELLSCCRADISFAQLKDVFPGAAPEQIQGVADELNRIYLVNGQRRKLFEIFHLDTCLRRAHFFAQAKVESKNIKGKELVGAFEGESFNHSIERLLSGSVYACFSNPRFPHLREEAYKIGRGPFEEINPFTKQKIEIPATQNANEKAIANIACMDTYRDAKFRLGNTHTGDGWNYRGRGMLQITGRSNYQSIQNCLDSHIPDNGIGLMSGNDHFSARQVVASGLAYWTISGMYLTADLGTTANRVDAVTHIINLATDSYGARRSAFDVTSRIFDLTACINRQLP